MSNRLTMYRVSGNWWLPLWRSLVLVKQGKCGICRMSVMVNCKIEGLTSSQMLEKWRPTLLIGINTTNERYSVEFRKVPNMRNRYWLKRRILKKKSGLPNFCDEIFDYFRTKRKISISKILEIQKNFLLEVRIFWVKIFWKIRGSQITSILHITKNRGPQTLKLTSSNPTNGKSAEFRKSQGFQNFCRKKFDHFVIKKKN